VAGRGGIRFLAFVLGALATAPPAGALSQRYSYRELFDVADVVVVATPGERRVLDAMDFLPIPSGDSIPVVSVEARFQVRLGIKGAALSDSEIVVRYYLHRELSGAILVPRSDVDIGNECGSFDLPIGSPVDFRPEDRMSYLMFLKRLEGQRCKTVDGACPSVCIQPLLKEWRR